MEDSERDGSTETEDVIEAGPPPKHQDPEPTTLRDPEPDPEPTAGDPGPGSAVEDPGPEPEPEAEPEATTDDPGPEPAVEDPALASQPSVNDQETEPAVEDPALASQPSVNDQETEPAVEDPSAESTLDDQATEPTLQDPEPEPSASNSDSNSDSDSDSNNRWLIPVVAVALLFVLLIGLVVLLDGDEEDAEVSSGSSTTVDASATTAATGATSTVSTAAPAPAAPTSVSGGAPSATSDPALALWPATGTASYDDPVEAGTAFATQFLGFSNPDVGTYLESQEGAGEVDIRADPDGPNTILYVRRTGSDGSWAIFGASTNHIQAEGVPSGRPFGSPLGVQGRSTSPDGTVTVELRQDGATEPLGRVVATGGGTGGNFTPFSGWLNFTSPAANTGAIVYTTRSADGGVYAAAAFRVRYRA